MPDGLCLLERLLKNLIMAIEASRAQALKDFRVFFALRSHQTQMAMIFISNSLALDFVFLVHSDARSEATAKTSTGVLRFAQSDNKGKTRTEADPSG